MQSSRSKIEPQTAYGAFISYYFSDAALDERLSGQQRLLLLELSILAAGRGSCEVTVPELPAYHVGDLVTALGGEVLQ